MRKLLVLAICVSFVACSNTTEKNAVSDTTANASSLKTDAVNPAVSGTTAAPAPTASTAPAAETAQPATSAPAAGQPAPVKTSPATAKTQPSKPAASGGAAAEIKKGEALITKTDCLVCHKLNEKLIGPAYSDVAKKYPSTPANINMLADKIIKGGSGVWGPMAMTPHAALSMDDAKALVSYVLSIK